jgi:hypothetical protein
VQVLVLVLVLVLALVLALALEQVVVLRELLQRVVEELLLQRAHGKQELVQRVQGASAQQPANC